MDKGFRRVRPLEGGIEAWIEAGYAVSGGRSEKE
jgi:rhodanese-related sulfurtransferase